MKPIPKLVCSLAMALIAISNATQAWLVIAHFDKLDWKPSTNAKTGKCVEKYAKRIKSSKSSRTFSCSLWYGPKGTLGKIKSIPFSAPASRGSTVSTEFRL